VIAALLVPAFDLRAALRLRPALATEPAALAPLPGSEPRLGSVTAAAEARGVRPGMRLGEALATCPALVLVEHDPAGVEQAWEEILRGLENAGFAVEPAQPGSVLFETDGVERLYGGLEPALRRALAAVGPAWDPRAGAAERRFAALAAASVARPGQVLIVSPDRTRRFLAPLPLSLLPLESERYAELEELGVRTVGELAGLPGPAVADRLGPDGTRAWGRARAMDGDRISPRTPPSALVETLEFPDAVAEELTLRRGLGVLVDRLLDRPEREGRPPRKLALWARLVGGASWRRTVTLREPSGDPDRLRLALAPRLAELPAPVLKLRLEAVDLSEGRGEQLELVRAEGAARAGRLQQGLRQVRAAVGAGGVSTVVEVAPWSRIPEARTLLVPRDD
jgi:protein ImuB